MEFSTRKTSQILPNIEGRNNIDTTQALLKTVKKVITRVFMRPTLLAYKSRQRHYKKGPLQTNPAQETLPASVSLSVQWASLGTKWDRVSRGPGMEARL